MASKSSVSYTSQGKFPTVGKKTRKILKRNHDQSFRSVLGKINYLSEKLSDKMIQKYKLEVALTRMAKRFYDEHNGNINWSAIVLAIRKGTTLNESSFKSGMKKSRNEIPNFDIKIKKKEVDKYLEMYKGII